MVLKKYESVYSFSFNFHGIPNKYDQFIEFTGKLLSQDSQDAKKFEIFHCEGLFLCTTKDNRLVVWNPCTGQTRWIQSRPSSNLYENSNKSCDNYKFLCFSHNNLSDQNARPEIYEFNSDSWRVPDAVSNDWRICWDVAVSLKGNTYWLYSANEEPMDNFILTFDFTTERFERLPFPFHSDEHDDEGVVLSTVREEKLAFLCQNFGSSTGSSVMKIWVTNTKIYEAKDLSWSEFLVVDFDKLMVDGMTRVASFLVDEENRKVMCCDTDDDDEHRTTLYIVVEDIHKIVYR